jgi:hypothetical protein
VSLTNKISFNKIQKSFRSASEASVRYGCERRSCACKMDPLDPLVQEGVGPQVRMIINQPLPEHYESMLIPGRDSNVLTTWHSNTEMPERPKPATSSCPRVNAEDQSPEKDPTARAWDIESQVRMLLHQPPPENEQGKLMAGDAEVGPPTLVFITEKPERPKPAPSPSPPVKAVDQPLAALRPGGGTHGNKLAA